MTSLDGHGRMLGKFIPSLLFKVPLEAATMMSVALRLPVPLITSYTDRFEGSPGLYVVSWELIA